MLGKFLFVLGIIVVAIVPPAFVLIPNERAVKMFQKIALQRKHADQMTCRDVYRMFTGTAERIVGVFCACTIVLAFFLLDIGTLQFVIGLGVVFFFYSLLTHKKNYCKKMAKRIRKYFPDIENPMAYVNEVVNDINTNAICIYPHRFILTRNYLVIGDDFSVISVPLYKIQSAEIVEGMMIFLSMQIEGKEHTFSLGKNNNITLGAVEKLKEYCVLK